MNPIYLVVVVICLIFQLGIFIRRVLSFQEIKRKMFPMYLGLCGIGTSVVFTAVVTVLQFFASGNQVACDVAAFSCIFLYVATKAQLYLFFIERIHVVYRGQNLNRSESKLYMFNLCILVPYIGMLVIMIMYRYADLDGKGNCRIGLSKETAITLIVYDTTFSLYSVLVFLWPLYQTQVTGKSTRLLYLARRNAIGTMVSTISSILNGISVYSNSQQLSQHCLTCCALDVMVNVFVMNYLLSGSNKTRGNGSVTKASSPGPSKSIDLPWNTLNAESYKIHPMSEPNTVVKVTEDDFNGNIEMREGDGTSRRIPHIRTYQGELEEDD